MYVCVCVDMCVYMYVSVPINSQVLCIFRRNGQVEEHVTVARRSRGDIVNSHSGFNTMNDGQGSVAIAARQFVLCIHICIRIYRKMSDDFVCTYM